MHDEDASGPFLWHCRLPLSFLPCSRHSTDRIRVGLIRVHGVPSSLVLVNVGGLDIVDKSKKLVLAIVWQLMRIYILDMLRKLGRRGYVLVISRLARLSGQAPQVPPISPITSTKRCVYI